jgi:hypothetical protein
MTDTAELRKLTDRLEALEATVAQVMTFIAHSGLSTIVDKPKPRRTKRPRRRPPPPLHPFLVQCRLHNWYFLVVQAASAGEKLSKSGFAERYHLNLRELCRWFTPRAQRPGSVADGNITEALEKEAIRIQRELAKQKAPPEPEPIAESQAWPA